MTEYILAKKSLNGVTRMEMDDYFADSEIENLYSWLDRIEFSRPKKNVGKDFSDGGEHWKHFYILKTHEHQDCYIIILIIPTHHKLKC